MATPARNVSPLGREAPPIYAPETFAHGVSEGDFIVVSSDQKIATVEIKPYFRYVMGTTAFGHLSMSFSHEGSQLAEYFKKYIAKSMESLADPYAATAGPDPFEYRSVPYREFRIVKTKPKWVGSIPPRPINDD